MTQPPKRPTAHSSSDDATPALVLFDTVTRKTVPVGFGVMSADEVMERIFMLTNSKVGSDF